MSTRWRVNVACRARSTTSLGSLRRFRRLLRIAARVVSTAGRARCRDWYFSAAPRARTVHDVWQNLGQRVPATTIHCLMSRFPFPARRQCSNQHAIQILTPNNSAGTGSLTGNLTGNLYRQSLPAAPGGPVAGARWPTAQSLTWAKAHQAPSEAGRWPGDPGRPRLTSSCGRKSRAAGGIRDRRWAAPPATLRTGQYA